MQTSTASENDYDQQARTIEYIRPGLMLEVILPSLTGWWKNYMSLDWLALIATVIGGGTIYAEASANVRAFRMTMELSMTIALAAALVHVSSELAFILNSARLFRET